MKLSRSGTICSATCSNGIPEDSGYHWKDRDDHVPCCGLTMSNLPTLIECDHFFRTPSGPTSWDRWLCAALCSIYTGLREIYLDNAKTVQYFQERFLSFRHVCILGRFFDDKRQPGLVRFGERSIELKCGASSSCPSALCLVLRQGVVVAF